MRTSPIQIIARIALCAALIAVIAPFSIPLSGMVPISLATFCIMLMALLFGVRDAVLATLVYLVLGAVGLPVFSGARGGIGVLTGATGGFLVGYLLLAFFSGILYKKSWVWQLLMVLIGNVLMYVFGTFWYAYVMGVTPVAATSACVLPFLPGDAIKIGAAFFFRQAMAVRRLL